MSIRLNDGSVESLSSGLCVGLSGTNFFSTFIAFLSILTLRTIESSSSANRKRLSEAILVPFTSSPQGMFELVISIRSLGNTGGPNKDDDTDTLEAYGYMTYPDRFLSWSGTELNILKSSGLGVGFVLDVDDSRVLFACV
jgi:hypothetical protein